MDNKDRIHCGHLYEIYLCQKVNIIKQTKTIFLKVTDYVGYFHSLEKIFHTELYFLEALCRWRMIRDMSLSKLLCPELDLDIIAHCSLMSPFLEDRNSSLRRVLTYIPGFIVP